MASADYSMVTGSSVTAFIQALDTASFDGWKPFGALTVTGGVFYILVGKDTDKGFTLNTTSSALPNSTLSTTNAKVLNSIVYPPETNPDTLLGINTNPNKISTRS